ncbi:MAG: hypothetical protein L6R19_05370 [Alphaproteobacteria bacterium]|nr:hypothetical protein [Alphaproteobacteria bacterium]
MIRQVAFAGLSVLALAAPVAIKPAAAAPQPLGLVATIEPVPLVCESGGCVAVLASFCLMQSRLPPEPGDAYRPAEGTEVRIAVTRADGGSATLDGGSLLRFVAYTGYSSITVAVDQAALEAAAGGGVKEAIVEVGPRATLLPLDVAGDPAPLTEDEVALATGPWREQAEELFDRPNPRSDANRLVARAIGALPEDEKVDGPAMHQAAWGTALATPGRGFTEDGVALGRRMFAACQNTVAQSLRWTMRRCLENRLDQEQRVINQEYWDQQAGS